MALLTFALFESAGMRVNAAGLPMVINYSAVAESSVHSIAWDSAQDANGVMYFGSTSLLTFDGERWTSSALPQSFFIRRLHLGPDGRIWVAANTDFGWFERDSKMQWQFHSLRDKLPAEHGPLAELWGVSSDNDGATFVTQDAILRWNGAEFTIWKKNAGRRLAAIHADGRFFVHVLTQGIYEVDARGLRLIIPRDALPDALTLWMERRGSGWLLGTGKGLFVIDESGTSPFAPEIAPFIIEHRLINIARLRDGRLVVATHGSGLALLSSSGAVDGYIDVTNGLPSNYTISLLVDRDGDLWVTTGGGIVRINPDSRSTLFDQQAGLPRGSYRRITKLADNIIVAGDPTLYKLDSVDNIFGPIPDIQGRWHQVRGTSTQLILAGIRGAKTWQSGELRTLHRSDHDVFATLDSRNRRGEILLSDNRSIIARSPDGTARTAVSKLPDNATSLAEDPQGRLWMGTLSGGVLLAAPAADTSVEARVPPASANLPKLLGQTHVRGFSNGSIVVIADNGAWTKTASEETFTRVAHYPRRPIAGASETAADDTVWVVHAQTNSTVSGVGRIALTGSTATWEPHSVDELNLIGAPRSIFADVSSEGETTLWIGGTQAVLRHAVGRTLSAPKPGVPILRAFATTAAGERVPVTAALPYATRAVEFEFAAPQYSRRPQLRIESRIDGVDPEWIREDAGSNRQLTALRDGRYTIRARVVAETGRTSDEQVFSFEVLRPWWRTPWASAGFGVVIALAVTGAYRLRVRRLRQRNADLEQKVRERTEELERANAAKTEFVANMSHDIRNPLNGIVGLALALENTRLNPSQQDMVATLRECSTYLSSLVDDVLDFAAIEAGKVELRPRPFSPDELLRSIIITMKTEANRSGADLNIELDPSLPGTLIGDAGRIQQIVVNFVSNALKYAGGAVRLLATRVPLAPGEIEFAVIDNGPGLSEEEQAALFTKFSRLQRDRAQGVQGTGLGLAACRLLADTMGGSVGVKSAPDAGSRFFLRLPLIVGVEQTAAAAILPSTNILLVEDTDYNAWAAAAVLARLGLSCERARTGEEALRRFGEKRFNIVLLDRNLPDMDGLEVARRMREQEANESPAILVAVTAYCTAEDRTRCLEAGMDAFIGKPLTPEKLRGVLIGAGRHLLASATADLGESPPRAEPDLTLLTYLSDGSAGALDRQIARFLATLENEYAAATRAEQAGDFPLLATLAHQLHGQARMVGCDSLARATEDLRTAARAADQGELRKDLGRVRHEIDLLTAAIRPSHLVMK